MFITTFLKKIGSFFTSGKAQRALAEVERILPRVLPIVETIAKLTPTRTDDEILAAFEKYGVPFVQRYAGAPADALRYLAQELVRRVVPTVGQSVANLAIEAAVNASKK